MASESAIPRSWFRAQGSNRPIGYIAQAMDRTAALREGERMLGPFVLPPFQRPPVWTREQQVRFIESCWMGLPIGVYVFNMCSYGSPYDMWLLDGQQRITAVVDYMADAFPVYGYLYGDLPAMNHREWHMTRTFACLQTTLEDEAELREVYDRLAYGGTPHEPK